MQLGACSFFLIQLQVEFFNLRLYFILTHMRLLKNAYEQNLAEMTPVELSAIIDRWEGEKAALAKDITPV